MAWANSKMFRRTLSEMLDNTQAWDLGADACKVALYNGTITPDNDVTTDALQSYNGAASQWLNTNEVSQAVTWPAGGVALASPTVNVATDRVFWDAIDTASGANATLPANEGCLVYNTVTLGSANRGISYHYFGGAQQVTNGTFTVVWHANGIINCTL